MDKRYLLLSFVFILFLSSLAASEIQINYYNSGYKIFSDQVITSCGCGEVINPIVIENTGDIENTYKFATDSLSVSLSKSTITLKPGEKKTVMEQIDPACDSQGEDIKIILEDKIGNKGTFYQRVEIEECNNLLVAPIVANLTGLPCQKLEAKYRIYNPGNFDEEYSVEIYGFEGEVFLPESIVVPANKYRDVDIELVPKCSIYGTHLLETKFKTETTQLYVSVPLSLNIDRAYDFELEIESEAIKICADEGIEIPVEIENRASMNNSYSISLDSGNFEPDEQYIGLLAGEKGKFKIISKPILPNGEGQLKLNVESELGEVNKEYSIPYNVVKCYDFEVELITQTMCEDEDEIVYQITSRGEEDQELVMGFENPFGEEEYDEGTIELGSGEADEFKIDLKEVLPGEYNLKLIMSIEGKNWSNEFENTLEIKSMQDCYRPRITPKVFYVKQFEEKYKQKYFNIENQGVRETEYEVSVIDTPWLKVVEKKISLAPSESTDLIINTYVDDTISEGTYPIQLKIVSEDGQEYTEDIKGIVYRYSFGENFREHKCIFVHLFLLILLISAFLTLWVRRKNKKKKFFWKSILILVMILFFIVSLSCFDFYKRFFSWDYKETIVDSDYACENFLSNDTCSSKFYIRWDEDSRKTLDLNEYFFDPEGSELSYSTQGNENVTVTFSQDIAILSPKRDWNGIEKTVFIVTDEQGVSAESPAFYFHVINTKEFHMNDFLLDNYKPILILLIIVFCLLFVFFFLKYLDVKEEKEIEKPSKIKKL